MMDSIFGDLIDFCINIAFLFLIIGLVAYMTDRVDKFLEVIKFLIYGPLEIALDMVSDRVKYK